MDKTSQGWAAWKMSVIDFSEKHTSAIQEHVLSMLCHFACNQGTRRIHICESKTGGVKTPKHRVLNCLDCSIMTCDDRLTQWGLRYFSYRPMSALMLVCCYSSPDSVISVSMPQSHMVVFTLKQTAEREGREIRSHYLVNSAVIHLVWALISVWPHVVLLSSCCV